MLDCCGKLSLTSWVVCSRLRKKPPPFGRDVLGRLLPDVLASPSAEAAAGAGAAVEAATEIACGSAG
eukprot:2766994-Lingulodinium_polyedra.AAC.1